ncbi:hypothetical protein ABZ318_25055 [Streptomyces sp. NPDC006197]|uniref:hypothetical protein n=1 Tax=Streptomyces sp. NPDC006197 TaxID=3156685 RepID=UPI0033A0D773
MPLATGPAEPAHIARTRAASRKTDALQPLWLVTMPTRTRGGSRGIQTFAIRAASSRAAVDRAVAAAETETAVLHRRSARIDPSAATAVLFE